MVSTLLRPASRPLNVPVALGIPAVVAVILVLLELTTLDMDLARLFYNSAGGGFIGRHSFFLEDILHDRAKQLVIAFSLLAVLGFIASFLSPDSNLSNASWAVWSCRSRWQRPLSRP